MRGTECTVDRSREISLRSALSAFANAQFAARLARYSLVAPARCDGSSHAMLKDHSPIVQALLGTLFTWALTAAGAALVVVIRGKQVSKHSRSDDISLTVWHRLHTTRSFVFWYRPSKFRYDHWSKLNLIGASARHARRTRSSKARACCFFFFFFNCIYATLFCDLNANSFNYALHIFHFLCVFYILVLFWTQRYKKLWQIKKRNI